VRSLADVVSKEHVIQDSEYLETQLVAVPKNLVKDWNTKYERLTTMVVPRSSTSIASDAEYVLFSVVVFKRVHDEFVQKCRENKFIVRDFVYSEEEIAKQQAEFEMADTTEKELWVIYVTAPWRAITYLFIDGAPSAVEDKFFGVIPDPSSLESHSPFRRKHSPIWPSSKLRGHCNKA